MKKILIITNVFALALGIATFSAAVSANAATISNPKCVKGLREAQSRPAYQAFAMVPGGAHCGWTIQSSNSQSEANRQALHYCKSRGGNACYVAWPN